MEGTASVQQLGTGAMRWAHDKTGAVAAGAVVAQYLGCLSTQLLSRGTGNP